jgi:ketosteroid isomerase-like protein
MTMKRLFVLLLLSACCPPSHAADIAKPKLTGDTRLAAQVWNEFGAWLAAYEAHDLDKVMAFFDKDVQFTFQGVRDANYESLKAAYANDFRIEKPGTRWVAVPEEVFADGRMAIVRSWWELRVPDGNGGTLVKERNRGMDVLRKSRNGWKVIRSINYSDK